ncbi:hypothetical protein CEP51_013965 [Fusarium floridanum]|uniref:Uncharacterized protein n=1 Tax=Fusarium floridanum TaxID=1325733 RepID=A0A428Q1I3_9HYPO|nr:hypothetical protein CEP51_013965 [Fusarium floridanum]
MTASFQDKREYETKGETQDMTPTSSRMLSGEGETDQVLAVEPRVLHGHTLTKEIPFRDVCIAIWDGLLLEEPAAAPVEPPSPDTLRNRLLIKVKYAPPEEPVSASSSDDEEGRYRPYLQNKLGSNIVNTKDIKLSITFYSGQNISLSEVCISSQRFNPYVTVELHVEGLGDDHSDESESYERDEKYTDLTTSHKGCDIDFREDHLCFPHINGVLEELSWVRFQVMDEGFKWDELAGWACIRLDRLGNGY